MEERPLKKMEEKRQELLRLSDEVFRDGIYLFIVSIISIVFFWIGFHPKTQIWFSPLITGLGAVSAFFAIKLFIYSFKNTRQHVKLEKEIEDETKRP